MHPLIVAGKMPTLKHLVGTGAASNLATLASPLPPIMWTSIGTDMTADKHGVLDSGYQKATAAMRKPEDQEAVRLRCIYSNLVLRGG